MKTLFSRILPMAAWFFCLYFLGAERLMTHYETALILFAALLLVPEGLARLDWKAGPAYWLAVAGFCLAYLAPLAFGPLFALPYAVYALFVAVVFAGKLWRAWPGHQRDWGALFAAGYWFVAALWSLAFLAKWYPLGFDPAITHLTSAHFHVAGFVLTVIALELRRLEPGRLTGGLVRAALAGMPLVAAGIVGTRFGWPPLIETVLALVFVAMAGMIAFLQISLWEKNNHPLLSRLGWLLSACCLLAGMSLAALYALRFYMPLEWVNIPNMKLWHGTLNTLGFGWLGLLSYALLEGSAKNP